MGAFLLWTPDGASSAYTLAFDVVMTENPSFPNQIAEHNVETGANVSDNIRTGLNKVTLEVFVTNEPIQIANQWDGGSGDINTLSINVPGASGQPVPSSAPITVKQWFTLPIGVPILGALAAEEIDTLQSINAGLQPTLGTTFAPKVLQFSTPFDAVQQTHDALKLLRDTAQLVTIYGTKGVYDSMAVETFDMQRSAETGTGATFTIGFKQVRLVTTQTTSAPTPTKPRATPPSHKGGQAPTTAPNANNAISLLEDWFGGFFSVPQGQQP